MKWQTFPDRTGWWFVEIPDYGQLFVFASEYMDGLTFNVPISALSRFINPSDQLGDALVYIEGPDDMPTVSRGWKWSEMVIPDYVPESICGDD